ncbi:penicillin-binding protein 2 [Porphyrobacter sp. GA68]|uniref:penicillin-binding protein 2 n=1 Tax=Porphyrobacter sp. GA68 TaxID=2883480 RepID=UPI001D17F9FD|nr:penicillin-binding protein 2 [Porphyrobacter sp. GA68]
MRWRRRSKELINQATLKNRFDRRSMLLGTLQGGVGVLLAARMGYLAIAENEKYELESESNRVNLSLIPPRRGWILDRNGNPLASNRADFRVDVIPERMVRPEQSVALLGSILGMSATDQHDLSTRIAEARGFQAVEVGQGLSYEQFAAISVRLPEMPGVVPQRGFSRFYPTGPAVGHLLGYVGPASREEYEADRNPLLVTPGYKIGKDGAEKVFEQRLRGVPGARRVEVTASGRIVRDLSTREDIQGNPVQLTIDGPLQDFAARRLGPESGSVVVMDCRTGDLLCMSSMPSFDPNSFSAGIGSVEYAMLRENERVPLRNKVLQGLYPPGSTIKPMHAMAFLRNGIDPSEAITCGGGLRVGNRFFRCHGNHGRVDMNRAIHQSCNSYFYYFAQRVGFDNVADFAKDCGLGQRFDLPVVSQFFGTVPDSRWKMRKHHSAWQSYDTVNSSIGQGYYLTSPLQLAVMAARLATGRVVEPALLKTGERAPFASLDFNSEQIGHIRQAMSDTVNGPGTAGRARLPLENVLMAGKTGTAQAVGLNRGDGRNTAWRFRHHGLFVFFAPVDNPIYAGAIVVEHGGGSGAATPIAKDVMTYLFDPQKGMDALHALEKEWGGTAQQRLEQQYRAYASARGQSVAPSPPRPRQPIDAVAAESRLSAQAKAALAGEEVMPTQGEAGPAAATPPNEPAPAAPSDAEPR